MEQNVLENLGIFSTFFYHLSDLSTVKNVMNKENVLLDSTAQPVLVVCAVTLAWQHHSKQNEASSQYSVYCVSARDT